MKVTMFLILFFYDHQYVVVWAITILFKAIKYINFIQIVVNIIFHIIFSHCEKWFLLSKQCIFHPFHEQYFSYCTIL